MPGNLLTSCPFCPHPLGGDQQSCWLTHGPVEFRRGGNLGTHIWFGAGEGASKKSRKWNRLGRGLGANKKPYARKYFRGENVEWPLLGSTLGCGQH